MCVEQAGDLGVKPEVKGSDHILKPSTRANARGDLIGRCRSSHDCAASTEANIPS
jgi:hypothetical protein